MKFIVNGEEKNATLHIWQGTNWSPDFFADVEVNRNQEDELSGAEYMGIIEYWQEEVDKFNDGKYSEQFGQKGEDGVEDDREYGFFGDEL